MLPMTTLELASARPLIRSWDILWRGPGGPPRGGAGSGRAGAPSSSSSRVTRGGAVAPSGPLCFSCSFCCQTAALARVTMFCNERENTLPQCEEWFGISSPLGLHHNLKVSILNPHSDRSVLTVSTASLTMHGLVATTLCFLLPIGTGSRWVVATCLGSLLVSGVVRVPFSEGALGSCKTK